MNEKQRVFARLPHANRAAAASRPAFAASTCLLLFLGLLLGSCAGLAGGTSAPEDRPEIGDVQVRPADGMQMMFVPAGEFVMGSDREMIAYARSLCTQAGGKFAVATCKAQAFADEQPAHPVRLDAFWIDRTEVTNGQYQQCVQAGSCARPLLDSSYTRQRYYDDSAYSGYPVINIDSNMAAAYCAWAGARLPREAEWEYAARGPDSTIYPWGNEFDPGRLNYCDTGCDGLDDADFDDGYPDTAPVGSFPTGNSWIGAADLAGNVREWVSDWYASYPAEAAQNPAGPETGESKIPRGGSWYDTPDDVRSANRGGELPDYYRHNLGFRCALDAVP